MNPPYPLSAMVGQDDLKLALLLHAVDPKLGGVLIRGEKGSGKSTAARALATLMGGGAAPFVELPIGATEDRVVGTLDLEGALLEGRSRLRPGLLAPLMTGKANASSRAIPPPNTLTNCRPLTNILPYGWPPCHPSRAKLRLLLLGFGVRRHDRV